MNKTKTTPRTIALAVTGGRQPVLKTVTGPTPAGPPCNINQKQLGENGGCDPAMWMSDFFGMAGSGPR
jgi:hypothetical protein